MSTRPNTGAPPPLTIEDLMARWQVSEEIVKEHIRKNGLPYWDAGTGNGRRPLYRFRLADVEAWEANRRKVRKEDAREGAVGPKPSPATLPTGAPPSWDGNLRAAGRGKSRPPKRAGR